MLYALSITLQVIWKIIAETAPLLVPMGIVFSFIVFYSRKDKRPKSHSLKAIILPAVNLSETAPENSTPSTLSITSTDLDLAYQKTVSIHIQNENPSNYPITETPAPTEKPSK